MRATFFSALSDKKDAGTPEAVIQKPNLPNLPKISNYFFFFFLHHTQSTQPFSTSDLRSGGGGRQPKQGSPDFPLPSYFVQTLRGEGSRGVPRPASRHTSSLSTMSWVFPWDSYRFNTRKQRLYSELLRENQATLQWKLISASTRNLVLSVMGQSS